MIIKEMKKENLPREKALRKGISTCNDPELLAILLRSGCVGKNALELASEILSTYKDFPTLASTPVESFYSIKGISDAKALTLAATFEIARRSSAQAPYLSLLSAKEIFEHYRLFLGQEKREMLFLLCYDKRKRIRKEKVVFTGDENGICASSKIILMEITGSFFSYFVLLHNHPSGLPLPSKGEIEFTNTLAKNSALLGVRLLDHIIVSNDTYFSFHENDLMVD